MWSDHIMQIYAQIIILIIIYSILYNISGLSLNAWESQDWFVTARGGTFKLHLNLLLFCPLGWMTLRTNATRPQDIRLHIQHFQQTSIIAGLPLSIPSSVANYTSFNKVCLQTWVNLWSGNCLKFLVLQRSPGAKKLYPRSSHELSGRHYHATEVKPSDFAV